MKVRLNESDLNTEDLIELKNIIMIALRDSEHVNRFKSNNLNLIEVMKYGLISSLLAVPCSHDERLEILKLIFESAEKMIIDYDSRRGLE
jgi:hypothetical protein